MPVSARKAAGIIRNVLPNKYLERRAPVVLASKGELHARNAQIAKWEETKRGLMASREGRKYLAHHFPKSYQRAILAERSRPGTVEPGHHANVSYNKNLRSLFPKTGRRIMQQEIPQFPQMPNFMVGLKKVYLPNSVVTLRRNPRLEPYHAVFDVPLNFSKLDLKDYLWHLYGVKTISIRSQVLTGKLRRKYKVENQPARVGPMVRTKQKKKMIVQLAKPFTYPRMLNNVELKEYVGLLTGLIVGFRRKGMIWGERVNCVVRYGRSMDCRIIRILCTMYSINGVRWSVAYSYTTSSQHSILEIASLSLYLSPRLLIFQKFVGTFLDRRLVCKNFLGSLLDIVNLDHCSINGVLV